MMVQGARKAIDDEIDAMVGMSDAKELIAQIRKKVQYFQAGGPPEVLQTCLNIVITGNPGTGKTTFARLLFRFLRAYGVLKKDVFVECNALELKAKYVGHTSGNVKQKVQSALGGCLFLDEAYALAGERGSDSDSFSGEAIRTLLTEVENNRTGLLVVLAGYQDKMKLLMQADPGMPRRFPQTLHLADYTPQQLAVICRKVAKSRFGMSLAPDLEDKLVEEFEGRYFVDIANQNGGLAVNLVENATGRLAERIMEQVRPQASCCCAAFPTICLHHVARFTHVFAKLMLLLFPLCSRRRARTRPTYLTRRRAQTRRCSSLILASMTTRAHKKLLMLSTKR